MYVCIYIYKYIYIYISADLFQSESVLDHIVLTASSRRVNISSGAECLQLHKEFTRITCPTICLAMETPTTDTAPRQGS